MYELKLYLLANRILAPTFMENALFSAMEVIRDRGKKIFSDTTRSRAAHGDVARAQHHLWACIEILYRNTDPTRNLPDGMKILFAKLYNLRRGVKDFVNRGYGRRCLELMRVFPEFATYSVEADMDPVWSNIKAKGFWEKLALDVRELGSEGGDGVDSGNGGVE